MGISKSPRTAHLAAAELVPAAVVAENLLRRTNRRAVLNHRIGKASYERQRFASASPSRGDLTGAPDFDFQMRVANSPVSAILNLVSPIRLT